MSELLNSAQSQSVYAPNSVDDLGTCHLCESAVCGQVK